MSPTTQTAVVQTTKSSSSHLPFTVSSSAPVPKISSAHHVLVRVLAVALNPNDHKMAMHFNMPGSVAGCDFCGIVVAAYPGNTNGFGSTESPPLSPSDARARLLIGTRVCGALFPYNPSDPENGSFAQYCVADARLLVKVPGGWDDLEAASMGVGWSTISLATSDPNALALEGLPTTPTHTGKDPVLVYGGGTASGTLACQILSL